ncbi:hypothetical protein PWG71_19805 [Nocardiopsis sp. N85]|uniref:hypothetical protein n=1 Tax=Nocardiopsis sp. N85 TaxID=3029400 RepID=UPI00237F8049|nr:hypothetical protein [Nocardiopsis sp. N85]MDE3723642.1 hypothetical protein [Nocardiopsis sp. N85]
MTRRSPVPLALEVVDYLPNPHAPAALFETSDSVTWYLQLGAYTHETARSAAKTMSDEVLAALLMGFGLDIPCDVARRDPVGSLGPLAGAIVTAKLIPPSLRRRSGKRAKEDGDGSAPRSEEGVPRPPTSRLVHVDDRYGHG